MDAIHDSFLALRRLLALKRHEQPPPGYFDHLNDRVLDRLTVEEDAQPEDWIGALLARLRLRPAMVGVFSFALGAFYLAGLGYSGRTAREVDVPLGQFQPSGLATRQLSPEWEARPTVFVIREAHESSLAPVFQAGLPVSVMPPHYPLLTGNVYRVNYPVTSR